MKHKAFYSHLTLLISASLLAFNANSFDLGKITKLGEKVLNGEIRDTRDLLEEVIPSITSPSILDLESKYESDGITMFMLPSCGYCVKAKRYLDKNNIDYIEKNVQIDRQARAEMASLKLGDGVPQIVLGDQAMLGWDEESFNTIHQRYLETKASQNPSNAQGSD